ncbi:MAG: NAD(P)/FAD-dependent oxidoreductase, partial [Bryobacteraceae bacterium]
AGQVKLALDRPLVIYSRFDLNRLLLDRAVKSGAQMEKARVLEITRRDTGWRLRTSGGSLHADFCVIATGARNPLRDVGTQWTREDTMHALGYYVPGEQRHIDIEFLRGLEGYIWVFPRCGHLSVGICGKSEPAQALRARLERFMDERGIGRKDAKFYSHMLPSLSRPAWTTNRVAGDGWIAVGDAAGLVDPITGEGLYYAIRSGDLAGRVLAGATSRAEAYREALRRDFAQDLEFAAMIARRVFLGRFLFDGVPARMVQFIRRSPRFREVMQDLFAGTQPYEKLKGRLLRNLAFTIEEILLSLFVHRMLPGEGRS